MEKENKYSRRFREVRRTLGGITQQELADRLLLTRNYVAKIESGAKIPSDRVLSALEGLSQQIRTESTLPDLEATAPAMSEPPGFYGKNLVGEIWRYVENLMKRVGDDPARQGWVLEQLKEHLAVPRSWVLGSGRSEFERDLAARQGAREEAQRNRSDSNATPSRT